MKILNLRTTPCVLTIFFYSPNSKINRYCCSAKTTTTYLPTYDVKLLLLLRFCTSLLLLWTMIIDTVFLRWKNLTKKEKLKKTKCLTQCTKNYCVIATITNSILQSLNDDDLRKKEKRKEKSESPDERWSSLFPIYRPPNSPFSFPPFLNHRVTTDSYYYLAPPAPRPPSPPSAILMSGPPRPPQLRLYYFQNCWYHLSRF